MRIKKKSAKWLRSNKLSLNSEKSKLVIFCSKTKKELDEITIKVNKSKLCLVPNVNYLGVVLDQFLSWDVHVSNLCKMLAPTHGILSKLRHYVPQKTCISVYFSLLYLFILYGSLVWQFFSKNNINKVFILPKKCLRKTTFSFYKDHSDSLFEDLKLLKRCNVLKSEIIKFFYNSSGHEFPKSVCSKFSLVYEVYTRNTRKNLLIYVPKMSTSRYVYFGNHFLRSDGASLWNKFLKDFIINHGLTSVLKLNSSIQFSLLNVLLWNVVQLLHRLI